MRDRSVVLMMLVALAAFAAGCGGGAPEGEVSGDTGTGTPDAPEGMPQLVGFTVTGLATEADLARLQDAVESVEGASLEHSDLTTGEISVNLTGDATATAVEAAIESANFQAEPSEPKMPGISPPGEGDSTTSSESGSGY